MECLCVDTGNCFRIHKEAEVQKYEVLKYLTCKDRAEMYGEDVKAMRLID